MTAGGSLITLVGQGFGGGLENSLGPGIKMDEDRPPPWRFENLGYASVVTVGDTQVSEVLWISDTSIFATAPQGIGRGLEVLATIQGQAAAGSGLYSFVAPMVTSVSSALGPAVGDMALTVLGSSFGRYSEKDYGDSLWGPPVVQIQASLELTPEVLALVQQGTWQVSAITTQCTQTDWVSDSTLLCTTPRGSGSNNLLQVVVGGQTANAYSNYRYSYTGWSPRVSLDCFEDVNTLMSPFPKLIADKRVTKLGAFLVWLASALQMQSSDQIYMESLKPFSFSGRRASSASRLVLRLLGGAAAADFESYTLASDRLLVIAAQGQFQLVNVTGIQAEGSTYLRVITTLPAPLAPLPVSDGGGGGGNKSLPAAEAGGGGGGDQAGKVAGGVVSALLAVGLLTWVFRGRVRGLLTRPAPDDVPAYPPQRFARVRAAMRSLRSWVAHRRIAARLAVGGRPFGTAASGSLVWWNGMDLPHDPSRPGPGAPSPPGAGAYGVGGSAGLDPGWGEEEEGTESCCVCLDHPTDAVVIHDDERRSRHQVLCVECALRIVRAGASCPLCRAPILAILKSHQA